MNWGESFTSGINTGVAIRDRIDQRKREKEKEKELKAYMDAQAAERENLNFSRLSPEQQAVYLAGRTPGAGTPMATLDASRKAALESTMAQMKQEKQAELERQLTAGFEKQQAAEADRQLDESERFARMNPGQQSAFMAQQTAPVGVGVLLPQNYNPAQRTYANRMGIAREGMEREAADDQAEREAKMQAELMREMNRFQAGRGGSASAGAAPSATVQYGPDGSMQRQWVRGVSPVSMAGATQAGASGGGPVGGAAAPAGFSQIATREEYDRLPVGAPFVWQGKRGVKK